MRNRRSALAALSVGIVTVLGCAPMHKSLSAATEVSERTIVRGAPRDVHRPASYAGLGTKNSRDDAQISIYNKAGRTYIDTTPTDRFMQDGTVRVVQFMSHSSAPCKMRIKIFRPATNHFNFVGESELFTTSAAGLVTHALKQPIRGVRPGDILGYWIAPATDASAAEAALTRTQGQIAWSEGDISQPSETFASTTNGVSLPIEAFGDPPVAAMTGDSIEAGHGSKYNTFFDETGPAGDISAELGFQMRAYAGPWFTYQDYSTGSQTWRWVSATAIPAILFGTGAHASHGVGMQEIWIHCGINDINAGRSWEAVRADLDAVYGQLPDGCVLFIDEILPDNNFDDNHAAAIRAFNASYVEWAKGKPGACIVRCHDAVGRMRASTGQIDELRQDFDSGDGVHITSKGAAEIARLRLDARKLYYVSSARDRSHPMDNSNQLTRYRSSNRTRLRRTIQRF